MGNIVVTRVPPLSSFKSPPHTPLQSLSISVAKCCRVTTCLLCVTLPSPYPASYIIRSNRNDPFYPLSLPSHPSSPIPFSLPPHLPSHTYTHPLVTTNPFLESVSLLLFFPSVLLHCYTPEMREII